ncbi:MAG: undecaprenyl-diphosphate phosphatase [Planctomycetaceae bacterium]
MIGAEYLEAIVLGVVQGIAEFLPISSSGHLVVCGAIWREATGKSASPADDLALNVALHVGSLFSILWVYRRDLWALARAGDWRLGAAIVIATIPTAIVGLLFQERFETAFATPLVAGCGLLVTACLLVLGQRLERGERGLAGITATRAAAIGAFQAAALVPGISRSGSTIAAGLFVGAKRDAAAAFSFFIAIPAIGGAAALTFRDAIVSGVAPTNAGALALGAVVSFFVGVLALRGLLRVIARGKLHWFAAYCVIVGAGTIAWQLAEMAGS